MNDFLVSRLHVDEAPGVHPTPEKYQLSRRRYYRSKSHAKDVLDRRYNDSIDQTSGFTERDIDTPKTYQYTRLSIGRRKSNVEADQPSNEIYDDELKSVARANQVVPKSYQFSTMYRRAEPAGTYQALRSPPLHAARLNDSDAKQNIPSATCDCLFFLYNGFCKGHVPAIPYYNVRSSFDRRLVKWTDNPPRSDHRNNEDYNRWYT
jgi:hypothetical protein